MVKNYFKIAWRNLLKNRVYSFINIGGLAIGLASSVLIFLWIQNESNYDNYHSKAKNTYRINSQFNSTVGEGAHWGYTPLKFAEYIKENSPEIENFTRIFIPYGSSSLNIEGQILLENKLAFVDKNWFDIFDYKIVAGALKNFKDGINNIAMTETAAKKYFGNENPIGKILKYKSMNLIVEVVLKDNPSNTSFQFNVLVQNQVRLSNPEVLKDDSEWSNFNYQTFIVCKEGSNLTKISSQLTALYEKIRGSETDGTQFDLEPITSIHLDNLIIVEGMPISADITTLTIFFVVALFILLIACINYINLTTAKASQRTKEIAVKKIVGALKRNLFYQFFIESILTAFLASLLAIAFIIFGLPILENLVGNHFSFVDNPIIWFILMLTAIFSILCIGIYPSFMMASFQPTKLLNGIAVGGIKNAHFRKILVVFQFTFTVVLLIFTFYIFEQLDYLQHKKLGYEKENIFSFSIPFNINNRDFVNQTIIPKLTSESSIKDVTISNMNIVDINSSTSGSLNWSGKDSNWEPVVTPLLVASNFKEFFNLEMVEGRFFIKTNTDDNNNVVLNETAIKELKIPKPVIDQPFEMHGRKGKIIGVVKDFHFHSPREKIKPLVMYTNSGWYSTFFVKTTEENIEKTIASTEKIWKELIPDLAFNYEFLNESYQNLHKNEINQLKMFKVFASIVLIISCFGLFGLSTFAIEVRTKEIGIRKVLGATVIQIIELLSSDFLKLILASIVFAIPMALWAINKWVQNYAYHAAIGGWIFFLAGLFILSIALLTIILQSLKVAFANPIKSIRIE